jgi:hypothetical protein
MSDWIEEEAKRLAYQSARREKEIETMRFERAALLRGAKEAFASLIAAVKRDVESFNAKFPEYDKQFQPLEVIGKTRFSVRRVYSPVFTLKVSYDSQTPRIHFSIDAPNRLTKEILTQSSWFGFHLHNTGDVTLLEDRRPITYAEASKRLLLQALKGYRDEPI